MPKTFIVLGMHRSGTSLLAKSLNTEIHMGNNLIVAENFTQPKGYYESKAIHSLNGDILEAAGGDFKGLVKIPSEKNILEQKSRFSDRIIETLKNEQSDHKIWGWKDPKTTLTIKLFLPYLINPHFICIFREPSKVVDSFRRRDKPRGRPFDPEKTKHVVQVYNERLLSFLSDWLSSTGGIGGQNAYL